MGNCCTRGLQLKLPHQNEFAADGPQSDGPGPQYREASPSENRTVQKYNAVLAAIREKYGEYINANNSTINEQDSKVYPPQICENEQMYTGQWKWGKKHGKGVQVWPDGFVYEGEWMQGKTTGYGRLAHQNGQYYIGEWLDNKFQGHGKYVSGRSKRGFAGMDRPNSMNPMSLHRQSLAVGQCCEYQGMWDNDKQHGHGVEIWPDGSRFEGNFYEGLKHGKGHFKWRDGSSYEGDFNLNHIEGRGVFVWSDGSSYSGEWHNDMPHGQGNYQSADGRKYTGSYINGMKEGYGIFLWGEGQKYEGQWKADKQNGLGTYTNSKGIIKQGNWINGKLKRKTGSQATIMEPP